MCINKIKRFHRKYRDRLRNFYSSSIAGLFTGLIIGLFFSLITDSDFNRWINIFSYEIFAGVIYFIFTIFLIIFFYIFGMLMTRWVVASQIDNEKSKKKHMINFRINYFAGMYSATFVTSIILLNKSEIIYPISIGFILFYLPCAYFAVRTKK